MQKLLTSAGFVMLVAVMAARASSASPQRRGGPAGDPVKGQDIFAAQKCSLCHTVGKTGGKLGPDLSSVGTKRSAAWLTTYLPKPQAQKPENKMPPVNVKGQDLTDLVAYLVSLKK